MMMNIASFSNILQTIPLRVMLSSTLEAYVKLDGHPEVKASVAVCASFIITRSMLHI
ncbi:hypothetical protein XBO1_790006 [Xenorhabdus bovienii str. oregonense]|uniref:Uncharacterized protein n=1 Tax=Xenorhabdus bovienii str. oregonense TaxID=1398202 RepID=A0A077PAU3_XENBV|nr:hypothetical protein XBO1_790006 [Xenorhabdus bovienii str. oregonense]